MVFSVKRDGLSISRFYSALNRRLLLFAAGLSLRRNVATTVSGSVVKDGRALAVLSEKMASFLVQSKGDNTAKSYFAGCL